MASLRKTPIDNPFDILINDESLKEETAQKKNKKNNKQNTSSKKNDVIPTPAELQKRRELKQLNDSTTPKIEIQQNPPQKIVPIDDKNHPFEKVEKKRTFQ
jgi:hypothetical protein